MVGHIVDAQESNKRQAKKYPSHWSSSVFSACSRTIWRAGVDHKHCQHLINILMHFFQSELHIKWRLHPSQLELFCVGLPPFDLISITQTPPISCRAHLTIQKRQRLGFVFFKLCMFWSVALPSYFFRVLYVWVWYVPCFKKSLICVHTFLHHP